MGTTVRSVFERAPLSIPPPVVCWVIPTGIIDPIIIIVSEVTNVETRWNPAGYVLTTMKIRIDWRTPPLSRTTYVRGKFWRAGLVPAQPINPIDDKPLPMPFPTQQEIIIDRFATVELAFGTKRYDDTVELRVRNNTLIFGHKYIDLSKPTLKG